MLSAIYNTIFYEPIYNLLVVLVKIIPFNDLGVSIVLLTIIIRLILFPLNHKSTVTQRKIKEIEPEISKIKNKFKDNKEEKAKQIMELYRVHGISPFSSFLAILVQLPVFITLFILLKAGFSYNSEAIYSFISYPEKISTVFLGIIDITNPNLFISILAGVSQFFQINLAMPKIKKIKSSKPSLKEQFGRSMSMQMKYIMPIFIIFISQRFSSGLALYWTASNSFAIVHELIVSKKADKILGFLKSKKTPTETIISK